MMKKICILIPLLLLFHAVCRGVSDLRPGPSFLYHSYLKTWSNAQTHCRENHADLITIRDETHNEDFVKGQGWIGLYRENFTSEWKWSRGDVIANFFNWGKLLAVKSSSSENCAFKYGGSATWETDHCGSKHTFMCYEEKLVLVKEKKTWEQALEHCRALKAMDSTQPATAYQNHLYDLATLLTSDDHDFAREMAQEATTDEVWTGLRYLAGEWLWVGGEAVRYKDMNSCPTSAFCGTLAKDGITSFETRDCKEKKNFLCYKKSS